MAGAYQPLLSSPLTGPSDGRPWAVLVGPRMDSPTVALIARLFDLLGYQVCERFSVGDPLTLSLAGMVGDLETMNQCDVVVLLPMWDHYTHARWLVLSALLSGREFRDALGLPMTPPVLRLDAIDDTVRRVAPEPEKEPEPVTVPGVDVSPDRLQLDGRPWADPVPATYGDPYGKLAADLAGVDFTRDPRVADPITDVRSLGRQLRALPQYGPGCGASANPNLRYVQLASVLDLLTAYGV